MAKKRALQTPPESAALPLCGVDSHAHLDGEEFFDDLEAVLLRATACGVAHIGNVFLGPEEYTSHVSRLAPYKQIFYILGIHPCHGQRLDAACVNAMRNIFVQDARIKAVGEIGLDFYWDSCPKDVQLQAFKEQIFLAKELEKPIVIHSRNATEATIALLEANDCKNYPVLWHCFGGNTKEVKQIIHNGWHVSIPGPISYPSNKALYDAVACIPQDRLLLETDSPYLSPQEWRGKRNEPAFTVFTARTMAKARNMEPEELWELCGANARRFFSLDVTP